MPSRLFSPLTLRDLTLPNRVAVSPMCQYMAADGVPGDWHRVHLGQFAQSGPGLVMVEATGVEPEGRITPRCPGLWNDAQEAAFAPILAFARSVGESRLGIQLAHAGRKASTAPPWEGGGYVEGAEGWETRGPSALSFNDVWPAPRALDEAGIEGIVAAFAQAARRAVRLGFDLVEIHAAHGYLLHQFLSPLSNRRNDGWGGSLEGRMRLPLAVARAVRRAIPEGMPLLVRISATDWIEGGWDADQSVELCKALREAGCDMIDVSSGGLDPRQAIPVGPGYQVPFAARIRAEAGIPTMAVGLITDPLQAETILASGQADMVALARAMLWNPRWVWHAAAALGETVQPPAPYARAHPSLGREPFPTRP
jgi:2,4-dienoyl-CoA reductase-like NADH-dependent reductase (Old Yellow Enzyme family)